MEWIELPFPMVGTPQSPLHLEKYCYYEYADAMYSLSLDGGRTLDLVYNLGSRLVYRKKAKPHYMF